MIIPLHLPSAVPLYRSLSVVIYSLPSIRSYFIPPRFVSLVTGHDDVLHGDIYAMTVKNLVMYFSVNVSCISTIRIITIERGKWNVLDSPSDCGKWSKAILWKFRVPTPISKVSMPYMHSDILEEGFCMSTPLMMRRIE